MFKRKLIKVLKQTINSLEDDLEHANFKINSKDKLITKQQEEIKRLESKNKDLENNLEFVINNCRNRKIKELTRDYQSKN